VNENLRSIFLGTLPLDIAALAAVLLTLTRRGFDPDPRTQNRLTGLFLVGIALQCFHFIEEAVAHFNQRFPQQLGLSPWSTEFFVGFNLLWIFIWVLSAMGLRRNFRPAFFATWFFIIGMTANGIAHPLLAMAVGGYFPGLWTSPLIGVVGLMLGSSFWKFTASQ
jgi:hypothetical protein